MGDVLDKSALYSPSPERSEEELKLAQQLSMQNRDETEKIRTPGRATIPELKLAQQLSMQNRDEGVRKGKHRFKLPALLLRWMGIPAPARL